MSPPLYEGAVIDTFIDESPDAMAEMVGAFATMPAVAVVVELAVPAPRALTARRTTEYALPFDNPEIVSVSDVDAGDRVIQVEPLLIEYW